MDVTLGIYAGYDSREERTGDTHRADCLYLRLYLRKRLFHGIFSEGRAERICPRDNSLNASGKSGLPRFPKAGGLQKERDRMIRELRDKKVIFFDVGYTLDKPASGD